jgi:hypothetical protein
MREPSYIIRLSNLMGIAMALSFFTSCMKDKPQALPENLLWNPQLALPLREEIFGMNSESGFDTLLLEEDTLSGLPDWLGQHEVVMEGVFDFDPSTISDNLDKLNRILFRLNCSNQFPHTMYSQAYFHDGGGNVIDSMFLEGPVETPAAIVRVQGSIIDAGKAQHDALIEGDRLPALANTQKILFRSSFIVEDVDSLLIPAYPIFLFQIDSGLMLDLSFED